MQILECDREPLVCPYIGTGSQGSTPTIAFRRHITLVDLQHRPHTYDNKTQGDLEAGAQRPGAPAYDAPTYQSNSMTEPRSTKVGNPRGTARLSYRRHYEETLDRPPCSSSGRETGDVSQGQTHWPPKIAGERVSYSTRKKQQLDRPQPVSMRCVGAYVRTMITLFFSLVVELGARSCGLMLTNTWRPKGY